MLARQAYHAFVAKWEKCLPKVVTSLREAGEELLTFYRLPPSQWKCVHSTNAIERLNEEFRQRVKTQGALPAGQTAEMLLLWPVAHGVNPGATLRLVAGDTGDPGGLGDDGGRVRRGSTEVRLAANRLV